MRPNNRMSTKQNQPPLHNPQHSQENTSAQITERDSRPSGPDSTTYILQSLLGPSVTSWPFEESTLVHALTLRTEQEKTKQDYYKTESLSRTLELVKYAVNIGIPAHSIPLLFANGSLSQDKTNAQELLNLTNASSASKPQNKEDPFVNNERVSGQYQQRPPPSLSQPFVPKHERSITVSNSNDLRSVIPNTNNPMSTFKFGGGTPVASTTPTSPYARLPRLDHNTNILRKTTLTPKQQSSPAKMGAQAVATLAANRSPEKFAANPQNHYHQHHHASLPVLHQRHSSLPPKVSIPESETLDFSSASKKGLQESQAPSGMHQMSNIIQAKRQPPSSHMRTSSAYLSPQESMIQQHYIQFHHWKPSSGGDSPNTASHSASSSASSFLSATSSNSTSVTADNEPVSSPAKRRRSSAGIDESTAGADTSNESIRSELPMELTTPKKLSKSLSSNNVVGFSTPTKGNDNTFTNDNDSDANNNTLTSTASTPLKSPRHSDNRSDQKRFPNNILS